MQKLPESKNTIAQIEKAAEAFSYKVVEDVISEAKAATTIDSILKMASLFAELTMT